MVKRDTAPVGFQPKCEILTKGTAEAGGGGSMFYFSCCRFEAGLALLVALQVKLYMGRYMLRPGVEHLEEFSLWSLLGCSSRSMCGSVHAGGGRGGSQEKY